MRLVGFYLSRSDLNERWPPSIRYLYSSMESEKAEVFFLKENTVKFLLCCCVFPFIVKFYAQLNCPVLLQKDYIGGLGEHFPRLFPWGLNVTLNGAIILGLYYSEGIKKKPVFLCHLTISLVSWFSS